MKMRLILFFCLLAFQGYSQQLVFDPAVVSTLVVNHQVQQETLKEIRHQETQIAGAQKVIALKMAQIKEIEQKIYNSLSTVTAIISQSKDIIYASQVASDIGKYQGMMMDLGREDPVLLAVAVKTEAALIHRTADLFTYIATALLGGDINLMNNAERLNLIRHVIHELRVMRGIAYSIVRRMKLALTAGVWQTLNPFDQKYPNRGAAIVNRLLKDFKN